MEDLGVGQDVEEEETETVEPTVEVEEGVTRRSVFVEVCEEEREGEEVPLFDAVVVEVGVLVTRATVAVKSALLEDTEEVEVVDEVRDTDVVAEREAIEAV